jgi:hypothetical protein
MPELDKKIRPERHYPRTSHKPDNRWTRFRNQCAKALPNAIDVQRTPSSNVVFYNKRVI